MVVWLVDPNPFLVIYWGTLGLGVAFALLGWFMHLFGPCLMSWKRRVDGELAETAVAAQQRREREARENEVMEKIRAIAKSELAKYGRVRSNQPQRRSRRRST